MQWPVEELEKLRGKPVSVSGKVVKPGQHFEVTGLEAYQVGIAISISLLLPVDLRKLTAR